MGLAMNYKKMYDLPAKYEAKGAESSYEADFLVINICLKGRKVA